MDDLNWQTFSVVAFCSMQHLHNTWHVERILQEWIGLYYVDTEVLPPIFYCWEPKLHRLYLFPFCLYNSIARIANTHFSPLYGPSNCPSHYVPHIFELPLAWALVFLYFQHRILPITVAFKYNILLKVCSLWLWLFYSCLYQYKCWQSILGIRLTSKNPVVTTAHCVKPSKSSLSRGGRSQKLYHDSK